MARPGSLRLRPARALRDAVLAAAWISFLTLPILVIKVNTVEDTIEWRWRRLAYAAAAAFVLAPLWQLYLSRRGTSRARAPLLPASALRAARVPALVALAVAAVVFPFASSLYGVNLVITALIYVVLGLGLNIVVGLAGLLDLGYVAFYAVGAYAYALLNQHFGLGFWAALPVGMGIATLFGILLGFPVLRLRGDYLAIVTLGFGEIIRLVLENWSEFSSGPSGIANIPRPGFFGVAANLDRATIYLYFLAIAAVLFTIFVVGRLKDSRLGRSWEALREDEIACQAMGIDRTRTKLAAFALGASWAGMAGVIVAAKTTYINPQMFTFMESAMILSIVVLGGMGSIAGVVLAAFILALLPEHLRAFSEYRMLLFGAAMVLVMIFRPQGLIAGRRRQYGGEGSGAPASGG